jgi:hypothetical protein
MSLLRKRIACVITSALGLVVGAGVFVFNKSAAADPVSNGWWPIWAPPHHHPAPPAVPEVNTGLVLLPIVLAIVPFTWRHLLRRRSFGSR